MNRITPTKERVDELHEAALAAVEEYLTEAHRRVRGPEPIPLVNERRLKAHYWRARRAFEELAELT